MNEGKVAVGEEKTGRDAGGTIGQQGCKWYDGPVGMVVVRFLNLRDGKRR